jgi:hypothetical protein
MANTEIDHLDQQLTEQRKQIEVLVDMATVCLFEFRRLLSHLLSNILFFSPCFRYIVMSEFRKTAALEGLNESTGLVSSEKVVAYFARGLNEKENLIEKLKLRYSALQQTQKQATHYDSQSREAGLFSNVLFRYPFPLVFACSPIGE